MVTVYFLRSGHYARLAADSGGSRAARLHALGGATRGARRYVVLIPDSFTPRGFRGRHLHHSGDSRPAASAATCVRETPTARWPRCALCCASTTRHVGIMGRLARRLDHFGLDVRVAGRKLSARCCKTQWFRGRHWRSIRAAPPRCGAWSTVRPGDFGPVTCRVIPESTSRLRRF